MSRVLGAINLFYWTPTNSKLLATTSNFAICRYFRESSRLWISSERKST